MAALADLDELAQALPDVDRGVDAEGRPSWAVHGKTFALHRSPRPDAVDAGTGERLEDVLVFWVDSLDEKDLLVADARGIFFTTPHWNGYKAVLLRIRDLAQLDRDELRGLVEDAWLSRAPKRAAKAWLAEHGPDSP
jgi:hypothetical protein